MMAVQFKFEMIERKLESVQKLIYVGSVGNVWKSTIECEGSLRGQAKPGNRSEICLA